MSLKAKRTSAASDVSYMGLLFCYQYIELPADFCVSGKLTGRLSQAWNH